MRWVPYFCAAMSVVGVIFAMIGRDWAAATWALSSLTANISLIVREA